MASTTQRIQWVDYMKAFSIMAVVLNHTHITPDILHTAVYLVCLPAFFFASGLFSNTHLTPKEFFYKNTLRLLIPFLFWGMASWVAWLLIGRHYGLDADSPTLWWEPLLGMVYGKNNLMVHNPPLWFLLCLICIEWLYYSIAHIKQTWLRWLVVIALAICGCVASLWEQHWFWSLSSAMIILPLYAFAAEYKSPIIEMRNRFRSPILCVLLVGSIIMIGFASYVGEDVALALGHIGNPFLYYLTVIAVIGLWGSIALLIDRYAHHTQLLQYVGQNTLLILCTHMSVFGMIKGIGLFCHIPLTFYETPIGSLYLWVGTFVILLPAAWFINRYCPILVGKKRKTNP